MHAFTVYCPGSRAIFPPFSKETSQLVETPCFFQQRCLRHNSLVQVLKGTTIVMPEQRVSYVYHLHQSVVGYFRTSEKGREVVDYFSDPPHFIGLAGFAGMDRKKPVFHLAEARAITPATYCKTKREAVWDLLDDRNARNQIMEMICGTIYFMTTPTPLVSDLAPQIIAILDALARSIGVADPSGKVVIPGITHGDIAAMCKATRPTVSRVLERLEQRGIIEISRRNIVVVKPEALRRKSWS